MCPGPVGDGEVNRMGYSFPRAGRQPSPLAGQGEGRVCGDITARWTEDPDPQGAREVQHKLKAGNRERGVPWPHTRLGASHAELVWPTSKDPPQTTKIKRFLSLPTFSATK